MSTLIGADLLNLPQVLRGGLLAAGPRTRLAIAASARNADRSAGETTDAQYWWRWGL
jgi:hypothetical protein